MNKLKNELKRIDHKGYPAYKDLKGSYDFVKYTLNIEHVQGDPFASPSALSVRIKGKTADFPKNYYDVYHRRIALEDFILRKFSMEVSKISFKAKGSGKSGMVSASQPGQEIMERSACHVDEKTGDVLFRFVVGFPARGRSIDAGELEKILFGLLPKAVESSGIFKLFADKEKLKDQIELADDQKVLRELTKENNLAAFVADGSILPRESGVSEKPMKNAVLFKSPESMSVTFELPHKGKITGMGIKKGITLIVGGGYHGKSTLLRTLEKAVYSHIVGDGREYVVTDETGVKLRAEDGRSVANEDISLFIRNLPNGKDTEKYRCTDQKPVLSDPILTILPVKTHDIDVNQQQCGQIKTHTGIGQFVQPEVSTVVNAAKLQIKTNPEQLERILIHLLKNAAEYTESGKIFLDFKKRGAHTHQFIISDTGTGIPVEKQENLFKPFTEIKDLTEGDGLGLPICALIATKMNGSLTLDTSYTKGSRFVLELHT